MKDNNKINFIKKIRTTLGYNQEEFARRLCKSVKRIQAYEQGVRQPALDTIMEILRLFDCKVIIDGDSIRFERKQSMNNTVNKELNHRFLDYLIKNRCINDYIEEDFKESFAEYNDFVGRHKEYISTEIID